MGKVVRDLIEYNGISMSAYKNMPNFKQMNKDFMFCIPDAKPDIEQIIRVWVDGCVIGTQLVKTPVGTSLEGQTVTGYKLLVAGELNLKVQYVACNTVQSVHTAHTTFPFCADVVLPADTNPNAIVRASIAIEDIFSEQLDCRCIYNNITMMIVADVC